MDVFDDFVYQKIMMYALHADYKDNVLDKILSSKVTGICHRICDDIPTLQMSQNMFHRIKHIIILSKFPELRCDNDMANFVSSIIELEMYNIEPYDTEYIIYDYLSLLFFEDVVTDSEQTHIREYEVMYTPDIMNSMALEFANVPSDMTLYDFIWDKLMDTKSKYKLIDLIDNINIDDIIQNILFDNQIL